MSSFFLALTAFFFLAPLRAQDGSVISSNSFSDLEEIPPTEQQSHYTITVASYNVDNYLKMDRRVKGHYRHHAGKPHSEKKYVVKTIQETAPDVIGLMEIGAPADAHDLEDRLDHIGLHYHSKYLQGFDQARHILLLSRFPIIEDHSERIIPLPLRSAKGKPIFSSRGILDVTLELPNKKPLRLIALHLKSQIQQGLTDQEMWREAEAKHVDQHIAAIEEAQPELPIIMIGDCNDTDASPTLQTLGAHIEPLPLSDSEGNNWTEYWKYKNLYSRIDYMFVNKPLKNNLELQQSGVARPSFWQKASDHCLLYTRWNFISSDGSSHDPT